jgi:hypothetical protein
MPEALEQLARSTLAAMHAARYEPYALCALHYDEHTAHLGLFPLTRCISPLALARSVLWTTVRTIFEMWAYTFQTEGRVLAPVLITLVVAAGAVPDRKPCKK